MTETFTAFAGHRQIAAGGLLDVARAVSAAPPDGPPPQVFADASGQVVELDLRDGPDRAVEDYEHRMSDLQPPPRQGRGRPKLGVVAREVTLLPRHWDWLAAQPGGASAMLRRLVDDARRAGEGQHKDRRAREAAYRVMSALAGDLAGFEEAARGLFAGDLAKLARETEAWPAGLRDYVLRLAGGASPVAAAESPSRPGAPPLGSRG